MTETQNPTSSSGSGRRERIPAADLLRASEDRFRTLAAATYEGIAFTEGGVVVDANDQLAEMLGFTRASELVGKSAMDFTAPEDRRTVEQYIKSGSEEAYEHLALRADGSTFPVVARGRAIDLGGRPVRVTAIRDLTEHRQAEKALTKSEEKFRRLFEESAAGIVVVHPDLHLLDANVAFCEMLHYTREEVLALRVTDLVHPDDLEEDLAEIGKLISGEIPTYRHEERLLKKDGGIVWVALSATAIRDANGEVEYGFGMMQDITARKQAEEALRGSEERFRTVFEQAPVGIGLVEPADMRIVSANDALCEMLDYTPEEFTNLRVSVPDVVHADDQKEELARVRAVLAGELDGYREEFRLIKKDGEAVWVDLAAAAVRDAHGAVQYLIGMIQDVTARKQAQERLEELLNERERLVRRVLEAQEEERTNVAHDIHDGPTQHVVAGQMFLEAFRRGRQHSESAEVEAKLDTTLTYLDTAITETRRIIAGLRPAALDDLGLVGALRQYVEETAAARGLKIEFRSDVRSRLPDAVESTLFRIAQEALTNAIKHSGSESVSVTLLTTKAGVSLTVRDQGRGFEPDRVQDGTAGERVGLIGMRERAELLGGGLQIDSKIGEGATIRARIPLPKADPDSVEEGMAVDHE